MGERDPGPERGGGVHRFAEVTRAGEHVPDTLDGVGGAEGRVDGGEELDGEPGPAPGLRPGLDPGLCATMILGTDWMSDSSSWSA